MAKYRCAVCANASRKAENVASYTLAPCVEDELLAIWKTIATDNPVAASRVVEAAYETFAMLAEAFMPALLGSTTVIICVAPVRRLYFSLSPREIDPSSL